MAKSQFCFEDEEDALFSDGIPERLSPEDHDVTPLAGWASSRLMSEFSDFNLVAQGGYGLVFSAVNKTDGCRYAIKIVYHGPVEESLTEVRVHSQLNNCNIVGYKGCWLEPRSLELQELLAASSEGFTSYSSQPASTSEASDDEESDSQVQFSFSDESKTLVPYMQSQDPDRLTLVVQLEFCGQTLRDWLDMPRPADVSRNLWFNYRRLRALIMFWDLMNGIETVHLRGFVHHDIKPSNIFVMEGGGIKIGDFGLACWQGHLTRMHQGIGTESYAAPEQYYDGMCSIKSDIYSAGLILLEILLSPFDTVSERHAVLQSLKSCRRVPEMISNTNPDLCDLIMEMTMGKPQMRPHASTVKERLVTLMIPIAEEMYAELMKALTASVVNKLYLSESAKTVTAAEPSPTAEFMLNILDDLSAVGFIQPGQYRDVQDNLGSGESTRRFDSELKQKELKVKVMLQNKLGRYSRVAGM